LLPVDEAAFLCFVLPSFALVQTDLRDCPRPPAIPPRLLNDGGSEGSSTATFSLLLPSCGDQLGVPLDSPRTGRSTCVLHFFSSQYLFPTSQARHGEGLSILFRCLCCLNCRCRPEEPLLFRLKQVLFSGLIVDSRLFLALLEISLTSSFPFRFPLRLFFSRR